MQRGYSEGVHRRRTGNEFIKGLRTNNSS